MRAYTAYLGLGELKENDRSFEYDIGFHIHGHDYVAVGGMADEELIERVAESIRGPVPSKYGI